MNRLPGANTDQTTSHGDQRYFTWKRGATLMGVALAGAAWFVASVFLLVAMLVGEFRQDYRQDIGDIAFYVPLVGSAVAIFAVIAPWRRVRRGLALVTGVVGLAWIVLLLLVLVDLS